MDKIEVSQRAREAAAALWERKDGMVSIIAANTRLGNMDDLPTAQAFARFERDILATRTDATPVARKQFPILGSRGAKIDLQLVEDHGKQAYSNHYQTVERLAERGGLSWCELHAVLNNRPWQKLDENTAIAECRAIEARYLGAFNPPATDVAALVEAAQASAEGWANAVELNLLPVQHWQTANDLQRQLRQALAPFTKGHNDA